MADKHEKIISQITCCHHDDGHASLCIENECPGSPAVVTISFSSASTRWITAASLKEADVLLLVRELLSRLSAFHDAQSQKCGGDE